MTADSLLDGAGDSLLDAAAPRNAIQGSIYLMRHGSTALDVEHRSDGWLDLPLSDKGRIGLMPAQQYLKQIPLAAIYAPALKRTAETAHIVQSGTLSQPPIEINDEARTWNLGVLAGTRKRYGRPEVQKLLLTPDVAPLGGEAFNEFRGRFLPWFEKVAKKALKIGKPILIVCSGSNLRLLGQVLLGDADCLDLDEGGLACLHSSGGQWVGHVLFGAEDNAEQMS